MSKLKERERKQIAKITELAIKHGFNISLSATVHSVLVHDKDFNFSYSAHYAGYFFRKAGTGNLITMTDLLNKLKNL